MFQKSQVPQIIKVEASAGAGKTYALARHYVHLILHAFHQGEALPIAKILAITFTNKATIEMKERILVFLKKIAFNDFSDEKEKSKLIGELTIPKDHIQNYASQAIDAIMQYYDYFQVQTIDSFMHALLTGCVSHLNRSARFRVERESDEALQTCLDIVIDNAERDETVRKLFETFLTHYIFVKQNASWMPKHDIFLVTQMLFSLINSHGGSIVVSKTNEGDVFFLKKKIISYLEELLRELPEGTNKSFASTLEILVTKTREKCTASDFSRRFQSEEFPINKGYAVPDTIKKIWCELRQTICQYCETESRTVYAPYITIFNAVYDQFLKRAERADTVYLSELNKDADLLLSNHSVNIPELYYRLATRFRHYVMDEFQDTSMLQWRNLKGFVDEALATGGSFFYVGDKKQAIYQFKGGHAGLFDAVSAPYAAYPMKAEQLSLNYRSAHVIVSCVNTLFSQDNLTRFTEEITHEKQFESIGITQEDLHEVTCLFAGAEQKAERADEGYVAWNIIEGATSAEIHEDIFEEVSTRIDQLKKRGYAYDDIALLVRSNADVEFMTSALMQENIPVVSDKNLSLKQHRIIQEIMAFLIFLDSPIDNLAFSTFIMSPVFRRATKLSGDDIHSFLFSIHRRTYKKGGVLCYYTHFRDQFYSVWEKYIERDFFKKVGITPLYEFVRHICKTYRVFEHFPEEQAFIMRFLECITEAEETCISLSSFITYFNSLNDSDERVCIKTHDATNAVRIMTYHKAKGLEFPIVLLPFLSLQVSVDECIREQIIDDSFTLLHVHKGYVPWSSPLREIYMREFKKAFAAELNTVYVALTRAKDELYIYLPARVSGRRKNILNALFLSVPQRVGNQEKVPRTHCAQDLLLPFLPFSLHDEWIPLLANEFIQTSELLRRRDIRHGEIFHTALSCIGNCFGEDIDTLIKNALAYTQTRYPALRDNTLYYTQIKNIIISPECHDIFMVPDGVVFTEKELITRTHETKRVDRLLITEKEIIVIDYKTTRRSDEHYYQQVKEYINILKDLYPGRNIKGSLVYLDTCSREAVTT